MLDLILDCPILFLELPKEETYELEFTDLEEVLELEVSEEGILPYYKGSYEVTPRIYEQTLATRNKSMSDDVLVKEIPKAEVSNIYGTTIIIG